MDVSNTLALLSALSVASERVVEVVKGFWPWLNTDTPNDLKNEGHRKSAILIVSAIAGVFMALLAQHVPGTGISGKGAMTTIALGLLSAGGSGLWNSVQGSLNQLKEATKKLAT